MSEKEIIHPLSRLQNEVQALREEICALKGKSPEGLSELRGMLRRRGLDSFRENPDQHLLFPPTFSGEQKERFYTLFKRYSFRLFLREILSRKEVFRVSDVARFSCNETGRKYLSSLVDMRLVEAGEGRRYRLRPLPTTSLGPTLEWFIAEILRKEFSCPTLYGLRCKGTRYGGDYDVVAAMEGRLVYVEVKSSPPKHIDGDEVHSFWERLQDLIPNLALFLVDTELRLKDKIVPLFEAEQFARSYRREEPFSSIERIVDEIFFVPPGIYLLNSKKSIPRNIAVCFKHHFTSAPTPSPGKELLGARTD